MFLESIYLKNFQSWEKQRINFHKGFNAIIGASDSGKSSVIKAIDWVINNRPLGDEFKSWFSDKDDKTVVSLNFDEDIKISKERVGSKNIYKLPNGLTLSAFRSDVPQEVTELCNMREYNIQRQHEGYFLLQESPGERAKKLNKAVGLDIIDGLYSFLNSRTLEINRELKRTEEVKESIKEDLKKYRDLDMVEEIAQQLLEKVKLYNRGLSNVDKVSRAIKNIKILTTAIKRRKDGLKAVQNAPNLHLQITQYGVMQRTLEKNRQILETVKRLEKLIKIKAKELVGDKEEYIDILSKNKQCPTCGTKIDKATIDIIKSKL